MSDHPSRSVSRRAVLKAGVAGATAAAMPAPLWAQATNVPAIPDVTVRFGCFAVTNHAWTILASQKGFLKDVGITMAGGAPKLYRFTQVVPAMQNNEIDIGGMYYGLMTQTLDKLTNFKPILVYSFFQGKSILGSAKKGYKSVDEFMASGMDWDTAAKAALGQMKGKSFAVPNEPSSYPWNEFTLGLAGMAMKDTKLVAVEDPKIVQLAAGEQVDFAAPAGAVQIYQLRHQAGWKPVMTMDQQLKHMYSGAESPLNRFLDYDLIQVTDKYLQENRDTVFRFTSAMYRTLAYMFGPEQNQALTQYAPFINANAGSNLNAEAIKFIFEEMDPFFQWKDQEQVWNDPKYPLYFKNVYEPKIRQFVASGTIKDQAYDLDDIFQGKAIYEEMKAQKAQAEMLMAQLGQTLGDDRKPLYDKGKFHYDNFNYLDAVRFFEAARA